MLRKTIYSLLLTLLLTLISFSQSTEETVLEKNTKAAIKIEEFGREGDCQVSSRLDNFFVKLQENPAATGFVITYQGKNALPADYEVSGYERIIRNQIAFRNQDASRFTFLRGGFREELSTELWLVPNGADEPKPTDTVSAPVMPKDKTFLYGKSYLGSDEYYNFLDQFILPSVKAQMEEENRLAEEQIKAEKSSLEESNETKIEAVEETSEIESPTPEEIERAKFSWVNEEFGKVIQNRKDSRGVIIFYADDMYYDVGKFQNLFEEGSQKIAESNKIPTDRIQVIYGGYRGMIETEFWLVPKNGENPLPTAEERPIEEIEN